MKIKYPETAALARAAFEGSGCKTHHEFAQRTGAGLRSFRRWLAGHGPANALATKVLTEAAAGRLPKDSAK